MTKNTITTNESCTKFGTKPTRRRIARDPRNLARSLKRRKMDNVLKKWTMLLLFQSVESNFSKVGHVQLSSNFFLLCSLIASVLSWRQ